MESQLPSTLKRRILNEPPSHRALRNVGETIFLNISAIRLTYSKNMSFSDWYLTGELKREGGGAWDGCS
jgi:hypothetical protein